MDPVAGVVDDGGAEAEAAAHVAEGVVAHDGDVAQRLAEVGAQRERRLRRRRGGAARGGAWTRRRDVAGTAQQHDQARRRAGRSEQRRALASTHRLERGGVRAQATG